MVFFYLLFIPLIVASFLTHNPLKAMKKVLQVGLILLVPWSAWMYRNHLVGLDRLFSPLAVEYNHEARGLFRGGLGDHRCGRGREQAREPRDGRM